MPFALIIAQRYTKDIQKAYNNYLLDMQN